MSLKKDKSVPQLVEKYRHSKQTCNLERDLLRKLIRIENPKLFSESENLSYSSNLKKLDRYLKKSFERKPVCHDYITIDGKEPPSTERGWKKYLSKEAQFQGAIDDMIKKGFRYAKNGVWVGKENKIGHIYQEGNPDPIKFEK
jgi:hypothetical protein